MERTHRWSCTIYVLAAAAAVIMIMGVTAAAVTGIIHPPLMEEGSVVAVEEGWRDESGALVTMPAFLNFDGGKRISYSITLPRGNIEVRAPVLFFSARYINARFYLDGEHLGDSLSKPPGAVHSQGKVFTVIPLPSDYAGKELRLDVELLLGKGVSYEIPAPVIGCRASMGALILRRDLLSSLVNVAILCFSLILFLFGVQKGGVRRRNMFLDIGVFAMCFALYSLCTADILHLFCNNSYLIYVSEFLLLAVLPIPLVTAFEAACRPPLKRILQADLILLCGNFVLQAGLHFLSPLEVRNTVFLTHGMMLLTLPLLLTALLKGWGEPRRRGMILTFTPVFAGTLIDLSLFYLSDSYRSSFWVKVGVLLFVLLQTYTMVRDYIERYESDLRADFYHKMAYIDALTGLGNRAAFETQIAELKENLSQYSSLWCVCADINNLKEVNDNAGHGAGDLLIQGAASVLKALPAGEFPVYRTGGDEFVIFLINQSEQAILRGIRRLEQALEEYNLTHTISLGIAVGWDRFRFGTGDTVSELISRADRRMYEDKRSFKENSN